MRDPLKSPNERGRAYARERDLDTEGLQQARLRPRLGGSSPLPASGSSSELFLIQLDDLTREERAAPGWAVRLAVAGTVPNDQPYDLQELLVELTVTMGGTAHAVEVNAFPGATVQLVGEQISGKVIWAKSPVVVPEGVAIRWQVARGICATTGGRAFTIADAGTGAVPPFATGFALFSGDPAIDEDIQLDFATHGGGVVLQHYTKSDLLQAVSSFSPIPPGAGEWRWLTTTGEPMRLVFSLGELAQ